MPTDAGAAVGKVWDQPGRAWISVSKMIEAGKKGRSGDSEQLRRLKVLTLNVNFSA